MLTGMMPAGLLVLSHYFLHYRDRLHCCAPTPRHFFDALLRLSYLMRYFAFTLVIFHAISDATMTPLRRRRA